MVKSDEKQQLQVGSHVVLSKTGDNPIKPKKKAEGKSFGSMEQE